MQVSIHKKKRCFNLQVRLSQNSGWYLDPVPFLHYPPASEGFSVQKIDQRSMPCFNTSKKKEREVYLLWAMEYFNEGIFAFLASNAESRILGALNLKQSNHTTVPYWFTNHFCYCLRRVRTHAHKLDVGIELRSSFLKHPVKMLCVVTSVII